jgi:hypothetical protein
MKRTALVVSCLLASLAAEAQIYQYKDASGRTVYSDQPPPGGSVKGKVVSGESAASAPSAPAKAGDAPKTAADHELEFRKRQKEQQEAAAKSDKEAADKLARKQDCERARRTLEVMESGERVATRDEKGERVFLEDSQRAAEASRARKAVAELCR